MPPLLALPRHLALVCLFAFAARLCSARLCSAESFTVTPVHYDQGWTLFGLETSGNVVVWDGYTSLYGTYGNGKLTSQSTVAPDSSLIDNGSPCAPSTPAGFSLSAARCNGSLLALDGWDYATNPNGHTPDLYSGTDFGNDLIAIGGGKPFFMNAAGDIAWDDAYSDTIYEALPSAASVTPEPSSVLLLATGTSALFAAAKRRRRALGSL